MSWLEFFAGCLTGMSVVTVIWWAFEEWNAFCERKRRQAVARRRFMRGTLWPTLPGSRH